MYFITFQILAYNVISMKILYQYNKKLRDNFSSVSSKTNLYWLTFFIVGYTIAHLISTFIDPVFNFNSNFNDTFRVIRMLLFFIFFNIIFFKGWQQPEIFLFTEESARYKFSKLTKEEADGWIEKLEQLMKDQKLYLIGGIKIGELASKLEIPPRILSQILNERYNQNFFDYINTLRIKESMNILIDPANKKNILEILYCVGFNSKPSFNTAFKKVTGLTPTEFKRKHIPVNSEKYSPELK